jgi:hypothetical protein
MTYKELLEQIQKLPPANLNDDVTIYIKEQDEYFAAVGTGKCDDGVLDDDHLFITIKLYEEDSE